jgi:hypothetical protein
VNEEALAYWGLWRQNKQTNKKKRKIEKSLGPQNIPLWLLKR